MMKFAIARFLLTSLSFSHGANAFSSSIRSGTTGGNRFLISDADVDSWSARLNSIDGNTGVFRKVLDEVEMFKDLPESTETTSVNKADSTAFVSQLQAIKDKAAAASKAIGGRRMQEMTAEDLATTKSIISETQAVLGGGPGEEQDLSNIFGDNSIPAIIIGIILIIVGALASIVAVPIAILVEVGGPILTSILDVINMVIDQLITLVATAVDCAGQCICQSLFGQTFGGLIPGGTPTVCIDDGSMMMGFESTFEEVMPELLTLAESTAPVL